MTGLNSKPLYTMTFFTKWWLFMFPHKLLHEKVGLCHKHKIHCSFYCFHLVNVCFFFFPCKYMNCEYIEQKNLAKINWKCTLSFTSQKHVVIAQRKLKFIWNLTKSKLVSKNVFVTVTGFTLGLQPISIGIRAANLQSCY